MPAKRHRTSEKSRDRVTPKKIAATIAPALMGMTQMRVLPDMATELSPTVSATHMMKLPRVSMKMRTVPRNNRSLFSRWGEGKWRVAT